MSRITELYDLYLNYPMISTDTRSIEKDSLFFALKGENFNANEFVIQALEKGAAFAIVDDEKLKDHSSCFYVDDVLVALQDLARLHRKKLSIPFIGITGSNGKTTTKELLHAVLSEKYNVLSTGGNYNNHIGVPLTILRLNKEHEMAIIEMGANHIGEIEFLCSMSDPDYGLITNIGKAHLKGFGSYEGVRIAKTELYQSVRNKGATLFVNSDDKMLMEDSEGIKRILYGSKGKINVKHDLSEDGRIKMILNIDNAEMDIQSQLFGDYNYFNLLCAITIGDYFGVEPIQLKHALENYVPTNNRSQIVKKENNTIIMDAYNANPSSMELALKSFQKLKGKRKIVILGDMLELGDESIKEHQKMIQFINEFGFEAYLVGPIFKDLNSDHASFSNVDELAAEFSKFNITDSQILIKGSRGIKLENILDIIT